MRHLRLSASTLVLSLILSGAAVAQDAPPVSDPAPRVQDTPPSPLGNPASPIVPAPPMPALIVNGGDAPTAAPTIEAIPRVWAPSPEDREGNTAYGLYLSGRAALAGGEAAEGAALLSATERLTPEQPSVQEQAFTSALLAGDLDLAGRITPRGEGVSPTIAEAGALVSVVQSFAAGDARQADAALKAHPIGTPHARAGVLVSRWIAAAAGDWDTALAEPNPTADPLTVVLGRYDRARLLEHRRRYEEADAALKSLAEGTRTGPLFRTAYGEFLERRGKRDQALALYDAAIAAGAADPGLAAARARAASGAHAPVLPSLKEGAAQALTVAAQQASAEGAEEFSVVYLRLAQNLYAEPASQYRLGLALDKAGLVGPAEQTLRSVPDAAPDVYAAARVALGIVLDKQGRSEDALTAFREAQAANPADPRIADAIASQLMSLERYDEALALLNGPLLNTAEQPAGVRFKRGAAYESLGRVTEAEAELWAALQAEPDEPSILNYLGYLWVDTGTRVAEGAEMIARAHAAAPDDGNIQDSLGWSQYRQGQYDTAVATLEEAVSKEPANPEINDHLGDAYWQVGRRREAGWQWSRVLTLSPDAERRAEVEKKIADGLDTPTSAGG